MGLTLRHTRADVVRSAFEGIAHGVADALAAYAAEGLDVERIRAVGGGTKNPVWTQAVSDICGVPQHIVENRGASFGDAALSALAVGHLNDRSEIGSWTRVRSTVTPDPERRGRYRADHDAFKALYAQTKGLLHSVSTSRNRED